jgi:hypothetical protein
MIKWLQGTYNGLYKIVLEPYTPRRKMILMLVFAMILGLIIGYGIDPVQYYDGDPRTLEQSWQDEWVRLLADRYALTGGISPEVNQEIIERLQAVDDPLGIVDRLLSSPSESANVGKLQALRPLAEAAQPNAAPPPAAPSFLRNLLPWILGPAVASILVVVWSWAWHILIKNWLDPIFKRIRGERESAEVKRARERRKQQAAAEANLKSDFTKTDLGPPLMQRMSTFQLGYGQYDDSFSIEDAQGHFLGECGATIAEKIGADSPEKPTAIEVWLFDAVDYVRTITKVFMSEYAYNDPALRAKLESKGDLILIKPGTSTFLETGTLRLQARIVELEYGTGPTPLNSFFNKLTIELAAWRKADSAPVMQTAARLEAYVPPPAAAAPTPAPPPMTTAPAAPPAFSPAPYQPAPAPPPNPAPPPPSTLPGALPSAPPARPPAAPPRPAPPDDDPFGGTGDFTPIA